jgi:hypothetical protein
MTTYNRTYEEISMYAIGKGILEKVIYFGIVSHNRP